jgi:dephospho-CoA kinase
VSKKLKIGITGGIGSGKTTVCKIFEALGIPIYYADDRAKWLMTHDIGLVADIKKLFGDVAYMPDGSLNRKHISDIAFHNPLILKELNALVHPAVLEDGNAWHAAQIGVPYTIKEAALLFESNSYQYLDKVITVFAPKDIRLQRVILRGEGLSRKEVLARMSKQMPESEKMGKADFIIKNDGKNPLIPQVWALHQMLFVLASI